MEPAYKNGPMKLIEDVVHPPRIKGRARNWTDDQSHFLAISLKKVYVFTDLFAGRATKNLWMKKTTSLRISVLTFCDESKKYFSVVAERLGIVMGIANNMTKMQLAQTRGCPDLLQGNLMLLRGCKRDGILRDGTGTQIEKINGTCPVPFTSLLRIRSRFKIS